MRGTKTIEFPFVFEFSDGGKFSSTNVITVTAPNIEKYHVYAHMRSVVMRAMFGAAMRVAEMQGLANARKRAEEEDEDEANRPEPQQPLGAEFLDQVSLGLSPDEFVALLSYAKNQITNAPKLARVGEGSAPITDEVWERLEEAGGMEAVQEVIGSFASFFADSPKSRATSGKSSSDSSFSLSKAVSASNTPARRHSRS